MPTTPRAYYNENNLHAAEWLYNLQSSNLIAPGDVDTRDIRDVKPSDLRGYTQHHFFAGIGGWSLALRRAGVGDDEKVWTGSCPCQPFSTAGRRGGFADERHLWPSFFHLIGVCHPAILLGEQVAQAAQWLRLVRGDLESLGYAVGAIPVEAASAGADHLRDRFWFVGHDTRVGRREGWSEHEVRSRRNTAASAGCAIENGVGQADANDARSQGRIVLPERTGERAAGPDGLADTDQSQRGIGDEQSSGQLAQHESDASARARSDVGNAGGKRAGRLRSSSTRTQEEGGREGQFAGRERDGAFASGSGNDMANVECDECAGQRISASTERDSDSIATGSDGGCEFSWVLGADGKARRVKPGVRLLVDGVSGRVAVRRTRIEGTTEIPEEHWYSRIGALQGFGNAVDPRPAAEFIKAVM